MQKNKKHQNINCNFQYAIFSFLRNKKKQEQKNKKKQMDKPT